MNFLPLLHINHLNCPWHCHQILNHFLELEYLKLIHTFSSMHHRTIYIILVTKEAINDSSISMKIIPKSYTWISNVVGWWLARLPKRWRNVGNHSEATANTNMHLAKVLLNYRNRWHSLLLRGNEIFSVFQSFDYLRKRITKCQ